MRVPIHRTSLSLSDGWETKKPNSRPSDSSNSYAAELLLCLVRVGIGGRHAPRCWLRRLGGCGQALGPHAARIIAGRAGLVVDCHSLGVVHGHALAFVVDIRKVVAAFHVGFVASFSKELNRLRGVESNAGAEGVLQGELAAGKREAQVAGLRVENRSPRIAIGILVGLLIPCGQVIAGLATGWFALSKPKRQMAKPAAANTRMAATTITTTRCG